MSKSKKNKRKAGFSLAETSIALALITIVFSMTITSILAISSTYKKTENIKFFLNEINNYLECFKMEGVKNFTDKVNTFILSDDEIEITSLSSDESYDLVICYDADFNKSAAFVLGLGDELDSDIINSNKYFVKITVDGSFYAYAFDSSNEMIFKLPKPYISRYDYEKK